MERFIGADEFDFSEDHHFVVTVHTYSSEPIEVAVGYSKRGAKVLAYVLSRLLNTCADVWAENLPYGDVKAYVYGRDAVRRIPARKARKGKK